MFSRVPVILSTGGGRVSLVQVPSRFRGRMSFTEGGISGLRFLPGPWAHVLSVGGVEYPGVGG